MKEVVVVVLDVSRRWEWVSAVINEHFEVIGDVFFNHFAVDRGLLFMEDEKARVRLTDRGWFVESGIQIACAPRRSKVNTF